VTVPATIEVHFQIRKFSTAAAGAPRQQVPLLDDRRQGGNDDLQTDDPWQGVLQLLQIVPVQ
jgi:hypothetical protein